MAYTEKYVSVSGGGAHDGSSEANAWTLAEAWAGWVAGDRVNVISGSYTTTGLSGATVGTGASMVCVRGYNTTIGDLESQARNSDTSLNTTNFPQITCTGTMIMPQFSILQNLYITGSIDDELVNGSTYPSDCAVLSCKIVNSANSTSAGALRVEDDSIVADNDLECLGTSRTRILRADTDNMIYGNRIKGTALSTAFVYTRTTQVHNNVFLGNGINIGIQVTSTTSLISLANNTFYNCGDAIQLPNAASIILTFLPNNHITDSSVWLNNLYSATANRAVIEMYSRTRDNTTPRIGIGDGANVGEVTTDTGGPETDYADAPNGDITLIPAAPAIDAGLGM